MKRIDGKLLDKLCAQNQERSDKLGEGLENIFDNPTQSENAYKRVEEIEREMENTLQEIGLQSPLAALYAKGIVCGLSGIITETVLRTCVEFCAGVEVV